MRFLLAVFVLAAPCFAENPFKVVKLPGGASAVDAADAGGTIHAAFAREGCAFYAKWDGKAWTEAFRLGIGCDSAGEQGPRIAVAGEGVIGVVWQEEFKLRASVSTDGGTTWGETDPGSGAAGRANLPCVAGDGKGGLVAAWIDLAALTEKDEADLFVARLEKGAKKWTPRQQVNGKDPRVCPCCATAIEVASDGRILAIARMVNGAEREFFAFTSRDGGKTWEGAAMSADKWKVAMCPEAGVRASASKDGLALVWRSDTRLLASRGGKDIPAAGTVISSKVFADAQYDAAIDGKGRMAILWKTDAAAHAVLLGADGKPEPCDAPDAGPFCLVPAASGFVVVDAGK